MSARILVSRNKREGGYIGWRALGPMKRGQRWLRGKAGHQRVGGELAWLSLRDWSRR